MASSVALRVVEVSHDVDPKKVIWDKLNALHNLPDGTKSKWIDCIQPTSGDVVVAVYQRPEKMASSLYMPQNASRLTEDAFQGTVGMVVKVGPHYEKHADTLGLQHMPPVGSWVAFRTQDCTSFVLGDQPMRLLQGNFIRMPLQDPDCII